MKKYLFFFLSTICVFISNSQNGFTTYTTNLTISGVIKFQTAFLVDNSSNKWIGFRTVNPGANAGLVKYDNSTWTLYNQSSSPAFPSNNVTALAKDNIGNIWVGTSDVGLVKYDGISFTTYNTSNGLPSNLVYCIETVGNQVYIGTNAGLSRFDGNTFTNYNVATGKIPSDTITSIKSETANIIWLGGKDRLVQFNINGTYTTTSYTNNAITNSPGNINCVYIDAQNAKWLGTTNSGILKYITGGVFTDVKKIYDIFGSSVPNKVIDISAGINNGIVFKHSTGVATSPYSSSGLTELAPNNRVYQYFYPSPTYVLGDFVEKDGLNLLVSSCGPTTGYVSPKMYYSFNSSAYSCPLNTVNSNNFKTLDVNNVRAGIANRGDMHWDIGGAGSPIYEVPKGSGINSNFASALWIGGLDNGNQLHGAAQTYRQGGVDFWPGPLDTTNASIDTLTAKNYDKVWKVSYSDINTFINAYNSGSIVATPDMLSWPAHGSGNKARHLAPFVDHNGDGLYNPNDGDYPQIKGDQALYFIYNDKLATHSTSYTPMGIEVQGMAYAYGCPSVVNGHNELTYTTFYDYKIINRSSNNYHDVFVSMWSDVDLGYYGDDYIGCNVSGNYGFAYNADSNDETLGSANGYGVYMPAQGFAIMKGPLANGLDGIDNDNDGFVDEIGEECKLNRFNYFNNAFAGTPPNTTDPASNVEFYNVMMGKWKDGTSFTCGGNGYGGNTNTNWAYTGDPNLAGTNTDPSNTCGYWTEISAVNTAGDRRMVLSAGPFILNAGQMQEVEYAFVTSFDSTAAGNNLVSLTKLKADIQKINTFYNQVNKPNCLLGITTAEKTLIKSSDFNIYPNPSSSIVYVKTQEEGVTKISYTLIDVLGKEVMRNEHINPEFSINISSLKAGVYFLRFEVNNKTIVKKIVKE